MGVPFYNSKGKHTKGLKDRISALSKFDLNTSVVWIFDSSAVLTVIGHDMKEGRVKTSNGRSYVPDELEKHTK
jgi:hypothetical protein